ncbi:hypothetical protein DM02DRAFT_255314 [Periconia macrospinosa]|uniref:Uncharacterized protein n=1 Tax=Periconia macrospinosa TaxID=97972 RepID=A0A2V1E115_9PLEO|nr:hypothetical protein DM02DRAFT_255314 [Periconia macrospinosa]
MTMPWNYALHQINRSFEQLGQWYHDFILRSEASFQALHRRIDYLEKRQAQQDDEQIERVLRKILAEKFGDPSIQQTAHSNTLKNGDPRSQKPEPEPPLPKYVSIDPAKLMVEPDAVPSKAYGQTLAMLEEKLRDYPNVDQNGGTRSN